jgi:hypothetical protein
VVGHDEEESKDDVMVMGVDGPPLPKCKDQKRGHIGDNSLQEGVLDDPKKLRILRLPAVASNFPMHKLENFHNLLCNSIEFLSGCHIDLHADKFILFLQISADVFFFLDLSELVLSLDHQFVIDGR